MMEKAINIVVCLATILTLSSCDFFSEKQPVQDSVDSAAPVEGISQEIKNKIAAQDTLMNALVLKVDTLAQALSLVQKENAELKVQVAKLESPKSAWGYMTLASLVIAIIALVLSLLRKGISREKVDEIFSYNLDKSKRIAELKVAVSQLQSGLNSNRTSLSVNTSLQNLDTRLRSVESSVSRLSSKTNETQNSSNPSVTHRQEQLRQTKDLEYLRMGYANINSGNIFTKIFDSAQESCVFSIKFKSANKGEFNIISLDKIKSRNMWQEIVEYTGSIEEATSFKVEDYGICEKYDDVTWQVTKKLKIKLIK
ncbi:hypothetical protein [Phocaeicola sartorii]|jgi:lipoprotein|uniref:Lipoprotein n=1 Tax=Phocaeicola sartorii TaxID=671267 RepID=A0A4S2FIX3_9BACT|nr:hypothetical protein [Phocaeicola sartorii]TGY68836.1 hypothetical protein E5339_15165 [Phocaeicola sartorii]